MRLVADDEQLIERIYDMIADPSQLDEMTAILRERMGASASAMFSAAHGGPPAFLHSCNIPSGWYDDYAAYWAPRDLYVQEAVVQGLFRAGLVTTGERLASERRFRRSEFFNDYWRPLALERLCTTIVDDGQASGINLILSFFRPPEAPPFEPDAEALLKRLTPHLRRAARLTQRLASRDAAPRWSIDLLDRLPWGAFLLDEAGHVVLANAEGERILRAGDGLRLIGGHLVASGDNSRLRAAIAHASAVRSGRTGTDLLLPRPSGSRALQVSVSPVGEHFSSLVGALSPGALVLVLDPQQRGVETGECLAELFALTPAERRLALDLLAGLTLAGSAARRSLSVETMKTHLKGLFAKTDTHRQSELVARLVRAQALAGPRDSSRVHPNRGSNFP